VPVRLSRWRICTNDAEHLVHRNPEPVRAAAPGWRTAAPVLTPLELVTKIAAIAMPDCGWW